MKRSLGGIVGLLIAALTLAAPSALAQADPAAVHQQYVDALNRGDVAGVMAVFADDASWLGTGPCRQTPCSGKAAIQTEVARQVATRARLTVVNRQATSGSVTARVEVRSDPIRAAGVERIVGTETVEVRGDQIAALRFAIDPTDPQTAIFLAAQAPNLPNTGAGGSQQGWPKRRPAFLIATLALCGLLATRLGRTHAR